jgi:hypothetical protein
VYFWFVCHAYVEGDGVKRRIGLISACLVFSICFVSSHCRIAFAGSDEAEQAAQDARDAADAAQDTADNMDTAASSAQDAADSAATFVTVCPTMLRETSRTPQTKQPTKRKMRPMMPLRLLAMRRIRLSKRTTQPPTLRTPPTNSRVSGEILFAWREKNG